jgi:CheY-like chemotaxis protein
MNVEQLRQSYYDRFTQDGDGSRDYIAGRIGEILLVSTFYDAFVFEQDGVLSEQLFSEYRQLALSFPPRVTSVSSAPAALKALQNRHYDLVITTLRIGEMTPFDLAARVKRTYPDTLVLLLLNNEADLAFVEQQRQRLAAIDDVFLWNGDSTVFLAMIKALEDKRNVEEDAKRLVRVILVIEDSVRHYSAFLPLLYSQLFKQTQQLIAEEVTASNRQLRMRMRPKVILAHNYAEAERVYHSYKDNLLCVITDVQYEREGKLDDEAGVRFIRQIRADGCKVPTLMHSLDRSNEARARVLGAHFLPKDSPTLLTELRDFIVEQLGFGDFVFRTEEGTECARAPTMATFMELLRIVSDESVVYHARHNHFSAWLIAHGEIAFAKKIQPMKVRDFPTRGHLRLFLIAVFEEIERAKSRGRVVDFASWKHHDRDQIVRLREGGLGGKGRGLAFLNTLLSTLDYQKRFPDIDVTLPATAIIGTAEFDEFLESNRIGRDIVNKTDEEIRATFVYGKLSAVLVERLWLFIKHVRFPLAVRSSGLLEDSQSCPFAGVYKTFMIPNQHPDDRVRVAELQTAIKLVLACVFERESREYIRGSKFHIEEEKMAVVIQEIAGEAHDGYYYPTVSGVAQSYNFYPTGVMRPEDGIANIALGLGKAVVEGNRVYRFCPRFPQTELLAHADLVRSTQRDFWAIQLNAKGQALLEGEDGTLENLDLRTAERHGTLQAVASVYDHQNDQIIDGPFDRKGPRIVTFASILKYDSFPMAELLEDLLVIGAAAMGGPVEIEFAVQPEKSPGRRPTFFPLQIRPLNVDHEEVDVPEAKAVPAGEAVVFTGEALGNGVNDNLTDFIYIDRARFSPTQTVQIQHELSALNLSMRAEGRNYVLIGPGRWGSRDRFLGVPVTWADISEARAIVEADLEDFRVDASQGSHFFHNIVSMHVGYLKVQFGASQASWVDWEWLQSQPEVGRTAHCVHVRPDKPCTLRMDGKTGRAMIAK